MENDVLKMNCEYCGKEFEIKHGHYSQRFCCKSCSVKARNLEDAGLFNNGHHISTVAYILGLILTDGCIVDCSGHKYIVISLKEYDMIAAIRDIVCRTNLLSLLCWGRLDRAKRNHHGRLSGCTKR